MSIIILTDNEITTNTLLGGNIDVDRYRFCIEDAQSSVLEEILGETLYNKIETDFDNGVLSGLYLTLHTKYITPFLIHQSTLEYLKVGAYQVANGGIYKHTPANGTAIDAADISYLVNNQRAKAEIYQGRLEKWLTLNILPEWLVYNNLVVTPKVNNQSGGWHY